MTKTILYFAGMLAIFASCTKNDTTVPSCIDTKIEAIKNEPVRNPKAQVWQYSYNGKTVYFFPSYCCDMFSELYDDQCNLICNPDGGITGNGDGKCTDFFNSRKNEKLIWEDPR